MSTNQKPVKKPLSARPSSPAVQGPPDFFMNKLEIPADIKADIKAKGHEYKWVNYKRYIDNGGHEHGWVAYKRPVSDTPGAVEFGAHPDAILKRGDCLLATRPKEYGDKHREWNKYQTQVLSGQKKARANELRERAREAGNAVSVDEGFEDSSDE